MKITKRQLRRIIQEEKSRLLSEMNSDNSANFEDIMGQLSELLDEAFELCGRDRTAEVYWYNTMKGCIDGRATMHTMEATLEEMADGSGDEDLMEMGYQDGLAGRPPAYPEVDYYMVNYEDGKKES
tara:strand:+ start:51 stop:428 length:378 start_codon:yes stop_codon:yes gene_type:complete